MQSMVQLISKKQKKKKKYAKRSPTLPQYNIRPYSIVIYCIFPPNVTLLWVALDSFAIHIYIYLFIILIGY